MSSKYSMILTIILIVAVVAVIVIATIIGIKVYKSYKDERDARSASMEEDVPTGKIQNSTSEEDEENFIDENIIGENVIIPETNENNNTPSRPKVKYYKGYPSIGTIYIEKTKLRLQILTDVSEKALENSVGISYPQNPVLNKPGNVVIIGHNYRNGKLFSNNYKLEIGDKIQITDLTGTTLTYTIYEILTTSPTDSAYVTRDTNGNTEISLSTCTDDGNRRLVILAKVM